MIRFRCFQCQQKIGVAVTSAGRLVRCPRCRKEHTVPTLRLVPRGGAKSTPARPAGQASASSAQAGTYVPAAQPSCRL